ncbi:MAG: Na+/H+ antiporter subunit E [Aeromicrobium sp.]|nr:Na+/H+ antiporter subunit E [Aeromicrobium sp.]
MRRVVSAAVLIAFWLVVTGSLDPVNLVVGLLASVIVARWAERVLWAEEAEPLSARAWLRLPGYLAYLIKEIVVAAVCVAERVLDPKLGIRPALHTHRVSFQRDSACVAFANSITLTPGTITLDVEGDTYTIHCLDESFTDAISSGDLEHRVSRTFDG